MNTYKMAKTNVCVNHDGYHTNEQTFIIHCTTPETNTYFIVMNGFSDSGQFITCCDIWYNDPDFGWEYVTEFININSDGFNTAIRALVLDCIEWAMFDNNHYEFIRKNFVEDLEGIIYSVF